MNHLLSATLLLCILAHTRAYAQPSYDWHHDTYDAVSSRVVTAENIAAGDSDFVYVAGQSNGGVDFDFGAGTANLSDTLHANAYVAVYTTTGVYARSWCLEQTANGSSQVSDMCIAGNGDVLITGYFTGTIDFSPGAASTIIVAGAGNVDSYVARYTRFGQLLWVKTFAPLAGTWVQTTCIAEAANKIVVGGMFSSGASAQVDLNPDAGVNNYSTPNCAGGFFMNLSASGTVAWVAGNIGANVQGIDMNASGTIAVTGQAFGQVDFDPGPNTAAYTAVCTVPCMGDFFVARYGASGNYQWHYAVGHVQWEGVGFDVCIMPTNEIHVIGYCGGLIDLDGGPGSLMVNNSGNFCAKYYANGTVAWGWDGGGALEIDAIGNTYLLDHNGMHLISNAGSAYWSIPCGFSFYGGSIGRSQNNKVLVVWQSNAAEDVDPGPGTINVNSPTVTSHPIHLSLQDPTLNVTGTATASIANVYPNPACEVLNIELNSNGPSACTIINALGETVMTVQLVQGNNAVNVSALAEGVYYLRQEPGTVSAPFVVVHR